MNIIKLFYVNKFGVIYAAINNWNIRLKNDAQLYAVFKRLINMENKGRHKKILGELKENNVLY